MDLDLRQIPHLIEDLGGVWAIHESRARELLEHYRATNWSVHIDAAKAAADDQPRKARSMYSVKDGVATIHVRGPLTKHGSSAMPASTMNARVDVRGALRDDDVKAVLMVFDSPGGNAAGIDDLAQDIAALAAAKPTVAFIEDLGASAAYWAASQAGRVVANRSAFIGSIGVYAVINDLSKAYAMKGIKTYVIKTGEMKGAGIEGTEITDEQLAVFKTEVEAVHDLFVRAVAKGRKISQAKVKEMADGRVHIAAEALSLGLIDEIGTLDGAFSSLVRRASGGRAQATGADVKEVLMSGQAGEPGAGTGNQPLSIGALKAALPDSTAEFREMMIEGGFGIEQAKTLWSREKAKAEELKQAREETASAKADADKAKAAAAKGGAKESKQGVQPLADASEGESLAGDPVEAFNAEVVKVMDAGKGNVSWAQAARVVTARNPKLREAYSEAVNAPRIARRQMTG